MEATRTFSRSFSGGEISPDGFGRVDDPKYQSGLATCLNFIPLPHGPVQARTGIKFVGAAKYSNKLSKLLPFTYSTTQTMVLELGDLYIRFHTAGATLESSPGVAYEVATPYLEAELEALTFVQSNDVLTICHPSYAPRELRRLGALSWTLTSISFATSMSPPATPSLTANLVVGTANQQTYEYAVTSVSDNGVDESVVSVSAGSASIAITAITLANPGVFSVGYSSGVSVGQQVSISGVVGTTQLNGNSYHIASLTDGGGTYDEYGNYTGGAVTALTLANEDGTALNTSAMSAWVSDGTISLAGISNNLLTTGNYNSVTWTAVVGASYYNVYKLQNGVWAFIGQTTFTAFKDDNIDGNVSRTAPLAKNPFAAASDYPASVSYFEQRRCFGGTINDPQNLWLTRSGTESNMNYSIPSRDDDAISFRVSAREANTIRHLAPLSDLIALTSSAEWRITSTSSDALTPTTVSVRPQSYVGASLAQPVIVNNNLIYGAARGGHVREFAFSYQSSGFVTGDLSLRSTHLFDGYEISQLAYSKAPTPIVWAVSDSGYLLSLTYVPEQQIGAWAKHSTDGVFESICVVAEGQEDVLYAIVKRTIAGSTVRYVERKQEQTRTTLEDSFYVDSGVTKTGSAFTTVGGLSHLEGETVSILADGAVHDPKVVTAGSITLDVAADVAHVGLAYNCDLLTLPVALNIPGLGQGRPKNVNRAWVRVYASSSLWVGPDFDTLTEIKQRTDEPYGSPPTLVSDELEVTISGSWGNTGELAVRHSDPLPLTIVALSTEVVFGD